MQILKKVISNEELITIAEKGFGEMVKAVVDVESELIALDAELHSDLEAFLLEHGSDQNDLWGINYYPELDDDDFVEFDSMINIRPMQGNRSRSVEDESIQNKIIEISKKWIQRGEQ
jgi:hypothetical protein